MRLIAPLTAWICLLACASFAGEPLRADVVIYGATPGGIAASLSAGKSGRSVLLIEPTRRVGGLVTTGLAHTDYHADEGLTGTFLVFAKRVEAAYAKKYGPDSVQMRESMRGTQSEPSVNERVLEQMLAEVPG